MYVYYSTREQFKENTIWRMQRYVCAIAAVSVCYAFIGRARVSQTVCGHVCPVVFSLRSPSVVDSGSLFRALGVGGGLSKALERRRAPFLLVPIPAVSDHMVKWHLAWTAVATDFYLETEMRQYGHRLCVLTFVYVFKLFFLQSHSKFELAVSKASLQ